MRLAVNSCRRGFSFTEILFAVMILGIGFIMVAAMFPVAIKQTQATTEETMAANMADAGALDLQKLAAQLTFNDPDPGSIMQANNSSAVAGSLMAAFTTTNGYSIPRFLVAPFEPPVIHCPVWTFHDPRITALDAPSGRPVREDMWNAVCGNLIVPSDPRYAWVIMYRRDLLLKSGITLTGTFADYTPSPLVQFIVMGVQTRIQSRYTPQRDLFPLQFNSAHPPEATLEGHVMTAIINVPLIVPGQLTPSTISFSTTDSGQIAEGAYVVISDDGHDYTQLSFNGWIVRVGAPRPELSAKFGGPTFELAPGYGANLPRGFTAGVAGPPAQVIVVGRAQAPATTSPTGFDGGLQDISVYTTYVHAH